MTTESEGEDTHPQLPQFLNGPEPGGNTPLEPDELEGLIPTHLVNRGQLDEWEQTNILKAHEWVFRRRRQVLTIPFAQQLHRRMLGDTWTWAGNFRRSGKNIGVPWPTIPQALADTLENTALWLRKGTYPVDEAVTRFHHRMVWVHPFPNGNGRHGRLMADALLWNLGAEPFTWGRGNLVEAGSVRDRYLSALKLADDGNVSALLEFVRS